jgi:Protein of unknown function (DUF3619)
MNEQQTAYRIKKLLNQGLGLEPGKVTRLREARELALTRQRTRARGVVLSWADNVIGLGGPSSLISRVLLPMALLIFGLLAINQWRDTQQAVEIEEIDAAVLTGDLPVDAYLDKGFDAWLKRSSQ